MIRPIFHPSLIALAFSALGCSNEVTNTEGRTFTFTCEGKSCTLTPTKASSTKVDTVSATGERAANAKKNGEAGQKNDAHLIQNEGRVLLACPAESPGFDCRPLNCEEASTCSTLGGSAFTCRKSICQAPERELLPVDKLALCLAGTGDWQRRPAQLERLTLSRACTGDCVLPAACLSP